MHPPWFMLPRALWCTQREAHSFREYQVKNQGQCRHVPATSETAAIRWVRAHTAECWKDKLLIPGSHGGQRQIGFLFFKLCHSLPIFTLGKSMPRLPTTVESETLLPLYQCSPTFFCALCWVAVLEISIVSSLGLSPLVERLGGKVQKRSYFKIKCYA